VVDHGGTDVIASGLKLSVYFGESMVAGSDLACNVLMDRLARHDVTCSVLLRGIEGFGINRRIHAERFPDASTDLPLLGMAVGTREAVLATIRDVDAAVHRGLVTLESAILATGADIADADFPRGPGRAAKLTVYCRAGDRVGAGPAYRAAVALLRRSGATGAIVLRGVDGTLLGRRGRTRLFGNGARSPIVIISVGPAEVLRRCLPEMSEVLPEPVVTLEGIAQVKHDGVTLESPRVAGGDGAWQTIRVYTRRAAHTHGRPLYAELTRRLRSAGAAGATTILADWGFSSDEHPHGDRLGTLTSHRPTYTVCIDRPDRIADLWPVIDEITAEHGIVTSLRVHGYRERSAEIVNGTLDGV
jgi:PII-like signaling protein